MGRLYATKLNAGGHRVVVCDKPELFEGLSAEFEGSDIEVFPDGHAVSRLADFIVYSVEAAAIGAVVRQYGPSTKIGATVAGQTSVKAPEKEAFDKYLPADVDIVSVHSLHGPSVTTEGQPLVSRRRRPMPRSACGSRLDPREGWLTLPHRSLSTTVAHRRRSLWSRTSSGHLRVATST